MIDVVEARIAAIAAKQTGLPVIVSMVYDSGENKDRTMMGNSPEDAVAELTDTGIDGIGANCGQGIDAFLPICTRLWMKPNAGLPEMVEDQTVFRTTSREFVQFIPQLIEAGANFIGGCCGTDQAFIKSIRQTIDNLG